MLRQNQRWNRFLLHKFNKYFNPGLFKWAIWYRSQVLGSCFASYRPFWSTIMLDSVCSSLLLICNAQHYYSLMHCMHIRILKSWADYRRETVWLNLLHIHVVGKQYIQPSKSTYLPLNSGHSSTDSSLNCSPTNLELFSAKSLAGKFVWNLWGLLELYWLNGHIQKQARD